MRESIASTRSRSRPTTPPSARAPPAEPREWLALALGLAVAAAALTPLGWLALRARRPAARRAARRGHARQRRHGRALGGPLLRRRRALRRARAPRRVAHRGHRPARPAALARAPRAPPRCALLRERLRRRRGVRPGRLGRERRAPAPRGLRRLRRDHRAALRLPLRAPADPRRDRRAGPGCLERGPLDGVLTAARHDARRAPRPPARDRHRRDPRRALRPERLRRGLAHALPHALLRRLSPLPVALRPRRGRALRDLACGRGGASPRGAPRGARATHRDPAARLEARVGAHPARTLAARRARLLRGALRLGVLLPLGVVGYWLARGLANGAPIHPSATPSGTPSPSA